MPGHLRSPRKTAKKITFGVLVIGLGIVFFLHNFNLAHVEEFFHFWPLLFGVLALGDFIAYGPLAMSGHMMVLLAAGLQLWSLERYSLLEKGWPVALVYLGIILTLRALFHEDRKHFCHDTDERQ